MDEPFRFEDITNYWLIPMIAKMCPQPVNVPSSFSNTLSFKAKFLSEAANMLDVSNDPSKERLRHRFATHTSQLLGCSAYSRWF